MVRDTTEKARSGAPIPRPKERNWIMFNKKSAVLAVVANNAAIKRGLHGMIIAPKKKPKANAFRKGFLNVGVFVFGINFPMSTLNISNTLMSNRNPKANGEMIPITFVKETSSIVVKISPKTNIKRSTPTTIKEPSIASVFFCIATSLLFDA